MHNHRNLTREITVKTSKKGDIEMNENSTLSGLLADCLTECPVCSGQVSRVAPICPHCGHPIKPASTETTTTLNSINMTFSQIAGLVVQAFIAVLLCSAVTGFILWLILSMFHLI